MPNNCYITSNFIHSLAQYKQIYVYWWSIYEYILIFCHTGWGEKVDEDNNVHICSRIYSVQCCHDSSHYHLCQIQVSKVLLILLIIINITLRFFSSCTDDSKSSWSSNRGKAILGWCFVTSNIGIFTPSRKNVQSAFQNFEVFFPKGLDILPGFMNM